MAVKWLGGEELHKLRKKLTDAERRSHAAEMKARYPNGMPKGEFAARISYARGFRRMKIAQLGIIEKSLPEILDSLKVFDTEARARINDAIVRSIDTRQRSSPGHTYGELTHSNVKETLAMAIVDKLHAKLNEKKLI